MLVCEECGCTSASFDLGWSAFYVTDPDEESDATLVTYCADCLTREFSGLLRWLTSARRRRAIRDDV